MSLSPEYEHSYIWFPRDGYLIKPSLSVIPVPGTCGSLVNEGNILLLIHTPSSIHFRYPLSSLLYLGMLLRLLISTSQLDRWHRQSVKDFPFFFSESSYFHAVPMSMFSSSYCAGLWRGGLTHRISIQVFVPVYGGYQTVICKCATGLSRWLSFTCSFFSQPGRCLAVFAVLCVRFGGTFLSV